MQVIIISSNKHGHKHWHLPKRALFAVLIAFIAMISLSTIAVLNHFDAESVAPSYIPEQLSSVVTDIEEPHTVYPVKLFDDATSENFYAQQLGGLQAEAIRLKMLSQRIAEMAGLELSEFSIEGLPGQGGVEQQGETLSAEQLESGLEKLSQDLQSQQHNLATLEQFLLTKDTITSAIPQGRPVHGGWISSFYGYRIDPFTGKKTFHNGIDIAGKSGSSVNAVAEGIVSWVGKRSGYGGLVEVDHGNGYVTRYAHNKDITVELGQHVQKGDQLALMGSTGRSTGPHVHFEVLRDGKTVNPYNFVK